MFKLAICKEPFVGNADSADEVRAANASKAMSFGKQWFVKELL